MADSIKIGNLNISAFKVGGADCSIYLGDVKLYPKEEPTPSYPYTFYRVSRGGSGYTVECSASSADTITSAQTKSGLSKAQLSSTTATQTPEKVVFGDCCKTINSGACSGWTQLTSITISDSVEKINNNAFNNCQKVSELSIGSGITSFIGNLMFYNIGTSATTKPNLDLSKNEGIRISGNAFSYGSFNDITLPKNSKIYQPGLSFTNANSLKFGSGSIIYDASSSSNGAFASSNINSIDLNGVTSIGSYAFFKISGITSINIPSSVTNMGRYSFASGNSISSAHIDCTGKLGDGTFISCSALTSVEFGEHTTEIGTYAFQKCGSLRSVIIPSNISHIGDGAFHSCSGLTSVSIPDSITEIGSNTFAYCSKLTTLNIPSSVTKVGTYVFSYCSSLTSVTFNTVTPPTLDSSNTFEYASNCVIYVPSESVEAYKSASEWSNVASRIQAIPSYKWLATYDGGSTSSAECDASSAITENEISLTNLVEIEIGSCVTSIGNYAFGDCTSLTSITIGNGVTSIGKFAFNNCHAELTVLPTTPPTIPSNYTRPFIRNYLTAIYVPSELVDVYKTDTNWSYYASKIQAIPSA